MQIDFMVEEASMKAFLDSLLPTIISPPDTWVVHTLSCFKRKLEGRLRGYSHSDPDTVCIIIISDLDLKNCIEKKQWLEDIVRRSGLKTKTNPAVDGSFSVITRLAIQELESWLLGDSKALHAAYDRIPESIGTKSKYQNPDSIGNTWESLHALLKKEGYCSNDYPKIEVAWRVGQHMDYRVNKSTSFQCFIRGIFAFIPS
jgi:hypothetical protein